jgi:hypothetical protein
MTSHSDETVARSAEMLPRWRLTSYCLCDPSTAKGHFERNDEGVWVLWTDTERLRESVAQLLKKLEWHHSCGQLTKADMELSDEVRKARALVGSES